LIVEEFKEFLEAEGMLFRNSASLHEDAMKELSDLIYVCYNMQRIWDGIFLKLSVEYLQVICQD
jgi:hypothetical protein